jgi:phenylalanyl-tRNA synthetase beta chain
MPTIKVVKLDLFEQIGQSYTDEGFDELCFQFGIELDEVTSEAVMQRKEKGDREASVSESKAEEIIYKIDVPANRYDLLCVEGIARALKIFIGGMQPPRFTAIQTPSSPPGRIVMHVTPAVASIRPVVVCACLRGITFNRASYNSFIELQVLLAHLPLHWLPRLSHCCFRINCT